MCSRTEICIRKKNSCLAGGICAKPHGWKCSFAGRRGSVGWLCVILSGLRCSRSRSTPLQAGEMGFLPQPRALALKLDGCFPTWKSGLGFFFGSAFDPAELLFSYPEIRVGFFGNQHLIQLSCNAHPRARSLKSTLGISLVPQGSASCTSVWIFTGCHSPTSSLLPFKKIQISGVKWVGQRIYKKYLSSS